MPALTFFLSYLLPFNSITPPTKTNNLSSKIFKRKKALYTLFSPLPLCLCVSALSVKAPPPMAGAMKKVDKIRQIVHLKQLMMRWKTISLRRRTTLHHQPSFSDSVGSKPCTPRRAPSGFVFVYVGPERKRFVIPARFLNLPVFAGLLKETEEVFGLRCTGGLVLPCEVPFFGNMVKHLEKDEHKYGKLSLEEYVNMVSEVGTDSCCKESIVAFTPLLQKARV